MERLVSKLQEVLAGILGARSATVIFRRAGLSSNEQETLHAISDELGVSRERIRQIQAKAHRTLRSKPERWVKGLGLIAQSLLRAMDAGPIAKLADTAIEPEPQGPCATYPMASTPSNWQRWSTEEDAALASAWDKGTSLTDLSKAHGRTEIALKSRLTKLGVYYPSKRTSPNNDPVLFLARFNELISVILQSPVRLSQVLLDGGLEPNQVKRLSNEKLTELPRELLDALYLSFSGPDMDLRLQLYRFGLLGEAPMSIEELSVLTSMPQNQLELALEHAELVLKSDWLEFKSAILRVANRLLMGRNPNREKS